jgi:WD40 repeat protein
MHEGERSIVSLAFSPDFNHVFVQWEDGTITIRENKEDGQVVFRRRFSVPRQRPQRELRESMANSQFMFRSSASESALIRLINGDGLAVRTRSIEKPIVLTKAFPEPEMATVFSNDGQSVLILGQSPGPLAQWNLGSGTKNSQFEFSFSPPSKDSQLKVVQKVDSLTVVMPTGSKVTRPGQFVDVTSNGRYVATFHSGKSATSYRTNHEMRKLTGWDLPDGKVELWDTVAAKSLECFEKPYLAWFVDDQTFVVLTNAYGDAGKFYSREDNLKLSTRRLFKSGVRSEESRITGHGLVLAPDGVTLAIYEGEQGAVRLWRVEEGETSELRTARVFGAAHFSNNGKLCAVLGYWLDEQDNNPRGIIVIETSSGAVRCRIRTAPAPAKFTCFAFSADDRYVAVGTLNGEIQVWKISSD